MTTEIATEQALFDKYEEQIGGGDETKILHPTECLAVNVLDKSYSNEPVLESGVVQMTIAKEYPTNECVMIDDVNFVKREEQYIFRWSNGGTEDYIINCNALEYEETIEIISETTSGKPVEFEVAFASNNDGWFTYNTSINDILILINASSVSYRDATINLQQKYSGLTLTIVIVQQGSPSVDTGQFFWADSPHNINVILTNASRSDTRRLWSYNARDTYLPFTVRESGGMQYGLPHEFDNLRVSQMRYENLAADIVFEILQTGYTSTQKQLIFEQASTGHNVYVDVNYPSTN